MYAIVELEQLNWKLCEPQVPIFALNDMNDEPTMVIITVSTDQQKYAALIECIEKNIRVIKCVS